jgi:murein L,D-transpeptidase YcbB/YkuD
MMTRRSQVLWLAWLAFIGTCALGSPLQGPDPYLESSAADSVRSQLAALNNGPVAGRNRYSTLLALYTRRSFEPLWLIKGHPTRQALELLSEIGQAQARGLRPADYNINLLSRPPDTPEDFARQDIQLTLAAARFVGDLHDGRVDPREAGYDLEIPRPPIDVAGLLATLATAPSVAAALDAIEPQYRHYALLKQALGHYRELASHPELNPLPNPGKTSIKPGEVYVGAPALRRLLVALGDMAAMTGSPADFHLDPDTVRALTAFQARHGLAQDGQLGRDTYQALITPFTDRVRQIELSLERWRWLPPKLTAPSILVNIPQYRLFALYTTDDLEQQMLKMDVIVGKTFPLLQTPVFVADMRYIVLRPYWDIPYSILHRELLPSIKRDPTYISRNDYEIVRGQTDTAQVQPVTPQTLDALARGELRLRQKPGPRNPLGYVKFVFPNRYDVYLHGTATPALFKDEQRAFSHGCVRVADPMGLMRYVLRGNPATDWESIEGLLHEPGPHRIMLRTPIRVFILYTTALATEDGRTLFFRDIYGQDQRLETLLEAHSQRADR